MFSSRIIVAPIPVARSRVIPGSATAHGSVPPDLLDVVYQAVQLPLRIHFSSGAQREAVQATGSQVRKHRLDRAQAPGIKRPPAPGIDLVSHGAGVRIAFMDADAQERHLPEE